MVKNSLSSLVYISGSPPKLVMGEKKYGRRSRPHTDTEDGATDQSDADISITSPRVDTEGKRSKALSPTNRISSIDMEDIVEVRN